MCDSYSKLLKDFLNNQSCIESDPNYVADVNYSKLLKQLQYDSLVDSRRRVKKTDLFECENTSTYKDNDIYKCLDHFRHIDCWTKWCESWVELECGGVKFSYLKNLDADIVLLGKDSTGKLEYEKGVSLIADEKLEIYCDEIISYIDKRSDTNPLEGLNGEYFLKDLRQGFSDDVKTNINLKQMVSKYTNELNIDGNQKLFLMNSFVFLSMGNMVSSTIPPKAFKFSIENFVIPVLGIIKPKYILTLGADASWFLQNSLRTNGRFRWVYSSLDEMKMMHKKIVSDDEDLNFFDPQSRSGIIIPAPHPSRPKYFDSENEKHLGWAALLYLLKAKKPS